MKFKVYLILSFSCAVLVSCQDEALPKPKAQLRLEYPKGNVDVLETPDYSFEYNSMARIKNGNKSSLIVEYPSLNGAIFITHKPVEQNLNILLSDAQKLSYEHVGKADNILEQRFVNEEAGVYGMFYEVKGNAASQAQFYVTDSTRHFVTGALYFYAKPNYDSIYPAAMYLQNDIRRIMESLTWK
jgi:gliding motility-associated lipoprotein GldD